MTDQAGTVRRTVIGGCLDCFGSDVHWQGDDAENAAAEHHAATGHKTWSDCMTTTRWGCDQGVEALHQAMTAP